MIHTTARTKVYEVTFIPNERSEPEMNRHPEDDEDIARQPDQDYLVDFLIDAYEPTGEVISIIHIREDGSLVNLYGNRRYL